MQLAESEITKISSSSAVLASEILKVLGCTTSASLVALVPAAVGLLVVISASGIKVPNMEELQANLHEFIALEDVSIEK